MKLSYSMALFLPPVLSNLDTSNSKTAGDTANPMLSNASLSSLASILPLLSRSNLSNIAYIYPLPKNHHIHYLFIFIANLFN